MSDAGARGWLLPDNAFDNWSVTQNLGLRPDSRWRIQLSAQRTNPPIERLPADLQLACLTIPGYFETARFDTTAFNGRPAVRSTFTHMFGSGLTNMALADDGFVLIASASTGSSTLIDGAVDRELESMLPYSWESSFVKAGGRGRLFRRRTGQLVSTAWTGVQPGWSLFEDITLTDARHGQWHRGYHPLTPADDLQTQLDVLTPARIAARWWTGDHKPKLLRLRHEALEPIAQLDSPEGWMIRAALAHWCHDDGSVAVPFTTMWDISGVRTVIQGLERFRVIDAETYERTVVTKPYCDARGDWNDLFKVDAEIQVLNR